MKKNLNFILKIAPPRMKIVAATKVAHGAVLLLLWQ